MGFLMSEESAVLPPGSHPVRVTKVTSTSFTFTTLKGHFDPVGSTIKFSTFRDVNGNIYLVQEGRTLQTSFDARLSVAPSFASSAWDRQAAALREYLEQAKF
jgi:hypothetical protein